MLDALGQRYGCRPSGVVGINPTLGYSILFDLRVLEAALQQEQMRQTTGGKIKAKQAKWSQERVKELKTQGLWH